MWRDSGDDELNVMSPSQASHILHQDFRHSMALIQALLQLIVLRFEEVAQSRVFHKGEFAIPDLCHPETQLTVLAQPGEGLHERPKRPKPKLVPGRDDLLLDSKKRVPSIVKACIGDDGDLRALLL